MLLEGPMPDPVAEQIIDLAARSNFVSRFLSRDFWVEFEVLKRERAMLQEELAEATSLMQMVSHRLDKCDRLMETLQRGLVAAQGECEYASWMIELEMQSWGNAA